MLLSKISNTDCIKILDVGGTPGFWNEVNLQNWDSRKTQLTLLNKAFSNESLANSNIRLVVGDAKNMPFEDKEFDIVFSNSVIEHVGNHSEQSKMAKEIMRVGKKYFIQTPNFYFPFEPHFKLPCFQFFPRSIKVWILANIGRFNGKSFTKIPKEKANRQIKSITLLTRKQFVSLFNAPDIWEEKVLGLTKSFVVYGGW